MDSETIESVESAPPPVQHRRVYELNERVLCQHTDNLYYDAKVIGITESTSGTRLYTIHYQGWSKRYDETFEESKADFRMRPFTEADFAKAKEELKAAKEKTELNRRSKKSRPKKVPKTDENRTNNVENNGNGSTKVSKDSKKSAAQRAAKALSNRAKSSKYYNRLVPKVLTKRTHPCPRSNGVEIKTSRAKSSTSKKRYPIGLFGSMMMNRSRRRHAINGDQYSDSDLDSDSSDGDEQQPLEEIAAKRRQRPHSLDMSPHSSAHLHEQQQQRGVSDAAKPFCYFQFDNMDLPNRSKEILKIDMKMAGTGKSLPKLPARSSIAKILSEFERYMQQLNKSCGGRTSLKWKVTVLSLRECDDAIKDMFDIIVQGQLLTEKESVLHEKLLQSGIIRGRKDVFSRAAGNNLRPCEVYGYIHLLRFLASFPPASSLCTTVEGVVPKALEGFMNCLNVYLANRSAHLFNVDDDYVPIKMA